MLVARFLSFTLALVLSWAAVAKLVRPQAWSRALAGYRLPQSLRGVLTLGVPALEGGLAALFFTGNTLVAASATLATVALFSLAILRARALQGSRLPCGCFGGDKVRDYKVLLARNALLASAASVLLIVGRDVRGYPPAPSGEAWIAALLAGVGVGLIVWLFVGVRSGFRRGTIDPS